MLDRSPAAPTLFLLLSIALAACEGSEGPTGPAGVRQARRVSRGRERGLCSRGRSTWPRHRTPS